MLSNIKQTMRSPLGMCVPGLPNVPLLKRKKKKTTYCKINRNVLIII